MSFDEVRKVNVKPNRLSKSSSPYLLQHQYNPVDWFPWGEEAFDKAKSENKPIFLSIGYSSCHWCHVMAEESFENPEIAEFLNKHFVPVKVDREERPDIDRIYMNFVQVTTGSGGWPLSVFLTPDGKPFFGGTYFPPHNTRGRLGFMEVLTQIHRAWTERGNAVVDSANEVLNQFKQWFEGGTGGDGIPPDKILRIAAEGFKSNYDKEFSGFGDSPKFPQPSILRFLLYYGFKTGDSDSINMVMRTCKAIALGGIHDRVGGGFHRYSVDRQWILPHFEKMLYDNALLLLLFTEAYIAGDNNFFAEVARSTANYLTGRLRDSNGGFYSAEDADSEGEEGKYYLWSYNELKEILEPDEFDLARGIFNLRPEGNYIDPLHPSGTTGFNILYMARMPSMDEEKAFEKILGKIKQARERRVRPMRDEKILTAWNGFAIEGLSRAGLVLSEPEYIKSAGECIEFIKKNLYDHQQRILFHSWYDGRINKTQVQDDYAAFIAGLIEFYQATLDAEAIRLAVELAETMIEKFEDRTNGGFWQSPHKENELIYNLKDSFDGAMPSGNSLAAGVLLRLYDITGEKKFLESAERTFRFFANQMNQQPTTLSEMLIALGLYHGERLKAAVARDSSPEFLKAYLATIAGFYLPQLSNADADLIKTRFGNDYKKDTIYICTDRHCFEPITDLNVLKDFLKKYEFKQRG
jgi:uncharacterized protein YyaL (SSP411 family)